MIGIEERISIKQLCEIAEAIKRKAVSYTHLDVYKRQGNPLCLRWWEQLPGQWRR